MRTALSLMALVLAVGGARARAADPVPVPEFLTLADRRADIKLPAYTPEQRKLVGEQALLLLESMYVHRDLRKGRYGEDVDPVPRVKALLSEADRAQDAWFHSQLARIFFSQRDRHTNYYYPRPRACFKSALPFSLTVGQDPGSREPLIIVRSLLSKPEAIALSPGLDRVHVGDVLVRIDGAPVIERMKELDRADNGANPGASFRVRAQKLTLLNHLADPLPRFNTARLVFQDRTKFPYKEYSLELPWLSQVDAGCLKKAAEDEKPAPPAQVPASQPQAHGASDSDPYELEYNRFYAPAPRVSPDGTVLPPPPETGPPSFANLVDTKEPILHWKLLDYERAKVGYLRLDSFQPTKLSTAQTTDLIRSLLFSELKDTNGLIIDLRDNGGGYISFGESLIQLFTAKDVEPEDFSMLRSEENRSWLKKSGELPEYLAALEATPERARYSNPLKLTSIAQANAHGQAYFRPVVIITNGRCYSTCDMFTAGMQDHGAALVVGEDAATGGGGANVIEHEYFFSKLPDGQKAPFAKLPRGQNMRIAWRESLRVGPVRRLEIDGALAERQLMPDSDDVASSYAATASKLTDWLLERRRPVISELRIANEDRTDVAEGVPLEIAGFLRGTDRVEYRRNGVTVGSEELRSSLAAEPFVLRPPAALDADLGKVEALGFLSGERVWRRQISFRRVPAPRAGTLPLTFDFKAAPPKVFTNVKAEEGWSLSPEGVLRIGDGVKYADQLSTEAAWFLDFGAASPRKVTLDFEYATEEDSDFFELVAVTSKGRISLQGPVAGKQERKKVEAVLPEGIRGTIELRLEFRTDDNTRDKGVRVYGLQVE